MEDAIKREQVHEQDLERLRSFRPIDDTFMRRLFKNNIELAQLVLRIILDKPDLKVTSVETQVDMKRVTGARSLCLDAEAVDSENKKYDIEVQKASSGARPKRARYHSSVMDVENLDANQDFEDLPETYVVFITEHDIYKQGKPYYLIERMNFTTGEPFEDDTHILYVNSDYSGNDDFGKLMHDFKCSNPDDMHFDLLRERSKYYKESKEGVAEMCQIMEDMREETRKANTREVTLKHIQDIMENFKVTAEAAMNVLHIAKEEQIIYMGMLPKA